MKKVDTRAPKDHFSRNAIKDFMLNLDSVANAMKNRRPCNYKLVNTDLLYGIM